MTVVDAVLRFSVAFLNGARIPSMAEDVATDLSTLFRRKTGPRKYGLAEARDADMTQLYRGKCP